MQKTQSKKVWILEWKFNVVNEVLCNNKKIKNIKHVGWHATKFAKKERMMHGSKG